MKKVVPAVLRGLILLLVLAPLSPSGAAAPPVGLHALRVTPAPGALGVSPNSLVTVFFDRPVVSLARLGAGPAALTVSPPIPGAGRWLGTSTYSILPAAGLAPATTYVLTLNPALQGLDGSSLGGATRSWQFTTRRAAVSTVSPANGSKGVLPRAPIDITFGVPVVKASAQAHIMLAALGGGPLAGTFRWLSDRTVRFTPAQSLARGVSFAVQVSPGVAALGGPLLSVVAFTARFTVAPAFVLSKSSPAAGASAVDPYATPQLTFTAPPDLRVLARYVRVSPSVDGLAFAAYDQDTIDVNGALKPSTTYHVTLLAGLPSLLGDRLAATSFSFRTASYQPALQLFNEGVLNTYDAYRGVHIYGTATNVDHVTLSVYRLDESEFLKTTAGSFNQTNYTPPGAPTATYTIATHAALNKGAPVAQALGGAHGAALTPGYYAVIGKAPGVSGRQYLPILVTRSSLTLKAWDSGVLVWANDLKSGATLAGLPVKVVDDKGRLVAQGVTGADGVFSGPALGAKHLGYATLRALASRPGDAAACGTDWNNGIGPYDYNLNFDPTLAHARVYLNTDRPIYRPGQTVYFRGVARVDQDGRYHLLPAGTRVHLTATDGLSNRVLDHYLTLNAQGVLAGSLTLPQGAALGYYSVQATIGGESVNAQFSVAAYKKPTFAISVLADRGENGQYVQGQTIGVHAQANYYFGPPLPGANVAWTVSSATTVFQPTGYDDYTFTDQDLLDAQSSRPANEETSSSVAQTNVAGAATLAVKADLQGSLLPHVVTIEANATAPTGDQTAQSTTVFVHPTGIYVGLRPHSYLVAPGGTQGVDIVTVHPDGTPAPHVAVTIALQRRTVSSVLQYDAQMGYLWQNQTHDATLTSVVVTTDSSGRAALNVLLPHTGEYRIAGTARDAQGRPARTAAYVYSAATGDASTTVNWGLENNDRINVVADKRRYAIGQTAHILVSAPYPGMTAMVTLERGTVLSHRVLTIGGNSPVFDIPITRDSLPNLYVSVVLFKGAGASATTLPIWKMGYATLVVNPSAGSLVVTVKPRSKTARPGGHIAVAVHVVNGQGQPVAADLGVSLVDAAVLALATTTNGTANAAFYAQRPVGVTTAASMALFIDRLNLTPGSGKKGGGGAAGPGAVRTKFPDTAYWNPNVMTDAAGNAALDIPLPDNVTTWALHVDGSTADETLLGAGDASVIATKPVLVQPALPRFLTVGDNGRLGAVVNNTTGVAARVAVGGAVRASTGTTTLPVQNIVVPANGARSVYWSYSPSTQGRIAVSFQANGGAVDRSDAVEIALPVEENSLLGGEAVAVAGEASAPTATEKVVLPPAIEPGAGDLRIALQPSLAAGLIPARDALLGAGYDTTESLTSKLVGLLALKTLSPARYGLPASAVSALPAQEASTTMQLYAAQNNDGGWSWWPGSSGANSDPYISAYVYEGLVVLDESGYKVDKTVMANAQGFLRQLLKMAPHDAAGPNDDARAFILYALARAGSLDGSAAAALYERRAGLSAAAKAELALALNSDFGAHDVRPRAIVDELSSAAKLTSVDAHWEPAATPDGETMESSVGDTAVVVRALAGLDAANPLIARAVRWLNARQGVTGVDGGWDSTHATVLALRAVAAAIRISPAAQPNYVYRVVVNGVTTAQGAVIPSTAGTTRVVRVSIDRLRAFGAAVVTIVRTPRPGRTLVGMDLHYAVRLRYYPLPGSVGPIQSGISLTRRYLRRATGVETLLAPGAPAPRDSTLTVELHLVAPQDLTRVIVQDPLPAGAESVDDSLLTSSAFAQPGGNASLTTNAPLAAIPTAKPGQPQDLAPYLDHTELRDDRTVLFASTLPAGSYVYRYTIHLTTAGVYHVLPADTYQVHEPEVFGHTAEQSLTIAQ